MKARKPIILYRTPQAEKTRREILDVAVDLASAEGLEALTIGRLANELRLSKSGLFAHFGSKQELQLATVDRAKQIFLEEVVHPAMAAAPGAERLCAMLEAWISYVERTVFRGGCFFAAASAEFDSRPGAVRNEIALLTRAWIDALEEEAREAQRRGEISGDLEVEQLVFELHACVQEANWPYKLFDDATAFSRARRAIVSRISSAVGSSQPSERTT